MANKRKPTDYVIIALYAGMALLSGTELLKALPPNLHSVFVLFTVSCLAVFYRGDDHDE